MKQAHLLHSMTLLLLSAGLFLSASARDITVTGTVVDSADKPVEKAMVLLGSSMSVVDTLLDTAFTDSDGKFTKKITIRDNARALFYSVSKEGFATKTGQQRIPGGNDRVDLGKIVLGKSGPAKKVIVVGKVIDARTQNPVEKALVVLSKIGIGITDPPDSTYSSREGTFAQEVEIDSGGIGSIRPSIRYVVSKEGYQRANGTERAQRDTVNIGTIRLRPLSVPIVIDPVAPAVVNSANLIEIYSLKGQVLYAGKPFTVEDKLHALIGSLQPCVIHYKKDNQLLGVKKITQMR